LLVLVDEDRVFRISVEELFPRGVLHVVVDVAVSGDGGHRRKGGFEEGSSEGNTVVKVDVLVERE
jgi:hypothetical protein